MAVGQLFSQRYGYAVHALAYAANKPAGELTTLPELAAWMRTLWPSSSDTYLANVVQRLARGGLLRSHRGVAGGYSLAKPAAKISLRHVAELLEGVDVSRCSLSLGDECPVQAKCSIRRKLERLEEGFLRSLGKVSIAQLAKDVTMEPRRIASA